MIRKEILWPAAKQAKYNEEVAREPLDNEVMIHTQYSLVSKQTESHWLASDANHKVIGTTFPFVPGYSSAGVVEKVGKNVTKFKKGDRVVGAPTYGAHSNYTYVDENNVYLVDEKTKLDDAVYFNLGMTGLYTFLNSNAKVGDSIALIGQGTVGSFVTQIAKAAGCYPILAIDINANARKEALANGADIALDPNDKEELEKVLAQNGGFDVAIDMSGSNAGMNLALHLAKKLGTVVLCTGGIAGKQPLDYEEIALKCLTVKGDFVNAQMDLQRKAIKMFLHFMGNGQLKAPKHALIQPTDQNIKSIYDKVLNHEPLSGAPIFKWY
ncbi:MAG: zinc-binding dehydrogenase [Limosilactobacillus sp.]